MQDEKSKSQEHLESIQDMLMYVLETGITAQAIIDAKVKSMGDSTVTEGQLRIIIVPEDVSTMPFGLAASDDEDNINGQQLN